MSNHKQLNVFKAKDEPRKENLLLNSKIKRREITKKSSFNKNKTVELKQTLSYQ